MISKVIELLLLAAAPIAAVRATGDDDFAQSMIEREQALHKAERRGDLEVFRRVLADDFVEIGPGGTRFGKEEVLAGIPHLVIRRLEARNFAVIRLGRDAAIIYYDLDVDADDHGKLIPSKFTISSAWRRRSGTWQVVFHQGSLR